MKRIPVRVDLAGGWLDVPKLARKDAVIVNCSISPLVSKELWPYEQNAGIGGSAAWASLNGKDPITCELELGVGWQDPAVILETGLCVWESGPIPVLICKFNPEPLLGGRMALFYTGYGHLTADLVDKPRDYSLIKEAGRLASLGVRLQSEIILSQAIEANYDAQLKEGMMPLPKIEGAVCKYCGSGFGGYGLYYFKDAKRRDLWVKDNLTAQAIEPYMRMAWEKV